jgi:transposase
MRHIQEAVDQVCRQEQRTLLRQGASPLTGTKYLWLYAQENIPEHRWEEFEHLRSLNLKVGRAWAIKESLWRLWEYISQGHALRFFQRWFWWATHSRLEPIRKVAHMFKRHLSNILTYTKHRLTNAVAEGFNNKIQQIKHMAYGFGNIEHLKIAIYFHCGGLDLYHTNAGGPE